MITEHTRHILIRKCTFFILVAIIAATIIRPLIAQQDITFTYIGIVNSVLGALLYFFVINTKPGANIGYWVIIYCLFAVIPLLLISGGVNSQFSVVLPVLPIFVCLLINSRAAWFTFGFLAVLIVSMQAISAHLPNLAGEQLSLQMTYARTFWLVMASLISTLFSNEFYRLSNTLSNKLQYQANVDSLTDIGNRRSVLEFLNDTTERARLHEQYFTVMMLDVDFFKRVNDRYGHAAGDKALRHIASILKSSVRVSVDGLGRYGGEEFLIVLPNVDLQNAQQVAEKILSAIEHSPLLFESKTINLTATIGYYCAKGEEVLSVEQILSNADHALYHGKTLGRNRAECFVF